MAGAGIKEIKNRIGSVQSTKQVTKAMELVSSSKMRKAKDRALASRPYFNTMYNTVKDIATNTRGVRDPFLKQREVKNKCYIVVAGDRGLAGVFVAISFTVSYIVPKYGLAAKALSFAFLIFEEATSSIALVTCFVLLTLLIRVLISLIPAPAN